MTLILLVLCVLAASISAYAFSARLFPASRLDTIALTLTLFLSILITATMSVAFLSLLQLIPVTLAVLLLSAFVGWASRWVKPLPTVSFLDAQFKRPTGVIASVIWISAWIVCLSSNLLFLGFYLIHAYSYMITNGDVMWIYMPNILNFLQAHSVWDFHGLWAYFSFNYELLFGWGILYTQNYALLAWFHLLPAIGALCYALCILNLVLKDTSAYLRFVGGLVLIPALLFLNTTQQM